MKPNRPISAFLTLLLAVALSGCGTSPEVTSSKKSCRLVAHGASAPLGMCAAQNFDVDDFRAFQAKRLALRTTGPVAAAWNKNRWDKSEVRVGFMDDPLRIKSRVLEIANRWATEGGANIRFVPSSVDEADIRVSFLGSGHWSFLGKQARRIPRNEQTMNLQFDRGTGGVEIRRVTLHEFGHALGLIHEHASPLAEIPWDKDAVYKHYMAPPNCWSTTQVDAQVLTKERSGPDLAATAFDKKSIMCYAVAPELTTDGRAIGWNNELSPTDKEFIAKFYPKNP